MATIEIIAENDWFVDIDEKVKTMVNERGIWSKHSIYRVQPHIRQRNKAAYTPQVVSFGPYHHCDRRLKKMEEHKERVLLHVLKRQNKSIRVYEKALQEVVEQLMDCYADLDQRWRDDPNGFLKLMILDGCFLLEILKTDGRRFQVDYDDNDPIFRKYGMICNRAAIKRDMILVENQLPLLLLHKLLAVQGPTPDMEMDLSNLIRKFIWSTVTKATCIGFTLNEEIVSCAGTPADTNTKDEDLHVLDVVWKSLIKSCHSPSTSAPTTGAPTEVKIRYATELREAGIRFRGIESSSLRDITFSNSTLTLPVLMIDDDTEFTLLNLMAFEKLHTKVEKHVSSFVCFMDDMIDTEKDVRLLHSEGVVVNILGSDRDAAKLFNRMAKEAIPGPPDSLAEVRKNANRHCEKNWNRWRANFKHTYLSNPWVFISLIAAIFLLALTVLQTIYAILPFYDHKDDNGFS